MNRETFVIIPFYNEAQVVRGVVEGVLAEFANVVCIDDGSTDRSAAEVRRTSAVLLQFPFNLGKGAALQTAFVYCLEQPDCEYLLTFDADGQHQVGDAVRLAREIAKGDCDMVLGSRFLGAGSNVPAFKRLLLKAAVRFTGSTAGIKLTDAHNGLRAFTREAAAKLSLTQPGFTYASEIMEQMRANHFRYREVPVTILYTPYSRRKGQPMLNSINILFDLLLSARRK